MNKLDKIFFIMAVTVLVGCASSYKPIGLISKIDATTYSTTTYGGDAASAAEAANKDAKGICKDNHDTEYFKIIKQEDKDLAKDTGSGLSGAVGAWVGGAKRNNQTTLTFKCM